MKSSGVNCGNVKMRGKKARVLSCGCCVALDLRDDEDSRLAEREIHEAMQTHHETPTRIGAPVDYLTLADYPLLAIGPCVYARSQSSPVFTATNDQMAIFLAAQLNAKAMSPTYATSGGGETTLVYGKI